MDLSIIVPMYNIEDYIIECLESIKGLKNIEYEVLVINDGTKDNGEKLVQDYCKKNPEVELYTKKNGGLSSARNYGLKKAKGKYIWFVDGDDVINSDEFEKFYFKIKNLDLDIILGSYFDFSEKKEKYEESGYKLPDYKIERGKEYLKLFKENLLHSVAIWKNLYNREFLLKNNILFEEGIIYEDYPFHIVSMLKAKKVKYIDKKIYYYRVNREGSIISDVKSKKSNNKEMNSFYGITINLIKNLDSIGDLNWIKEEIFNKYLSYLELSKKRDLKIEKELNKIKGIFFYKQKMKFKIWKRTYLYRRYSLRWKK